MPVKDRPSLVHLVVLLALQLLLLTACRDVTPCATNADCGEDAACNFADGTCMMRCDDSTDCGDTEHCDVCGGASCRVCADCVAVCVPDS